MKVLSQVFKLKQGSESSKTRFLGLNRDHEVYTEVLNQVSKLKQRFLGSILRFLTSKTRFYSISNDLKVLFTVVFKAKK